MREPSRARAWSMLRPMKYMLRQLKWSDARYLIWSDFSRRPRIRPGRLLYGIQTAFKLAVAYHMAAMSHVQGKQIAYGKLRAVSLGGGHGYLGAGPGIYDILALVGDGAAHYVYYGQHVGAALFRLAQGKEGIYGLAGLAYDYGYGPVSHYGIGIAELRCQAPP